MFDLVCFQTILQGLHMRKHQLHPELFPRHLQYRYAIVTRAPLYPRSDHVLRLRVAAMRTGAGGRPLFKVYDLMLTSDLRGSSSGVGRWI